MTTRTEPYACPVCGSRWDQGEQWDEDAQEWKFSDEPYGFCRTCTPDDDQDDEPREASNQENSQEKR